MFEWALLHERELIENWRLARAGEPLNPIEGLQMNRTAPRITIVRVVAPYMVDLQFTDGAQGTVDLRTWIIGQGPVFKALEDPAFFARVRLSDSGGTIEWPNGVDFCPDVLHHKVTGMPIDPSGRGGSEPIFPQS